MRLICSQVCQEACGLAALTTGKNSLALGPWVAASMARLVEEARSLAGCGKTPGSCHPEEPEATKDLCSCLILRTAEILRFAQNDRLHGFFRSLLGVRCEVRGPKPPLSSDTRRRLAHQCLTKRKVLYTPSNFGQDWINKGFQVEKGP